MTGDEDSGNLDIRLLELPMEVETTLARHPHVENQGTSEHPESLHLETRRRMRSRRTRRPMDRTRLWMPSRTIASSSTIKTIGSAILVFHVSNPCCIRQRELKESFLHSL